MGSGPGWNEYGHAIMTGLAEVDHWIGRGDLQDAENCGYLPWSVLEEMGVDDSEIPALHQFQNGLIRLRSGAVLQAGGTFGAVWACTELPDPARKWHVSANARVVKSAIMD